MDFYLQRNIERFLCIFLHDTPGKRLLCEPFVVSCRAFAEKFLGLMPANDQLNEVNESKWRWQKVAERAEREKGRKEKGEREKGCGFLCFQGIKQHEN